MRTADTCPTCSTYINALCVIYNGPYLSTLNIAPSESVELSLIKIEEWAQTVGGGGGGDTTLTEDVVSTLDVGGISENDIFLTGTTFTEFVKRLIAPTIMPLILSPINLTLSGVANQTLEVGTMYLQQISTSFSRGLIQSKDGSPNIFLVGPSLFTTYIGSGIDTSGFINTTIIYGNNQWGANVSYSTGTGTYYDSSGNSASNLDPQRVAGSVTNSTNIVKGRYRYWYSADNVGATPTTSLGVRALINTGFAESTDFDISIPASIKEVSFYIPATSNLVKVVFVESSNADVTSTFTLSTLDVEDAAGNLIAYKKYTAIIGGSGYPSLSTYKTSIN